MDSANGRDNQIRAWDSESGKQLWSSRFGGNFVGSPAMYEMDGRTYLLVPAASTGPTGRGGGQRVRLVGGELRDERDGSTDTCRWMDPDQAIRLRLGELARRAVTRLATVDA